jgi:hypothetical protein
MNSEEGHLSPSGVRIAADFRTNLIIDRYDPVFADMRASKLKHLRSANGEDAVTWNVFRSLRQIAPETWLPNIWQHAFPSIKCPTDLKAVVRLWESMPLSLRLRLGCGSSRPSIGVTFRPGRRRDQSVTRCFATSTLAVTTPGYANSFLVY